MKKLRVISLWQPWANLVIDAHKEYETRSWRPNHPYAIGSLLVIHAAKRWQKDQQNMFNRFQRFYPSTLAHYKEEPLQFGVALGIARLVNIVQTESLNLGDDLSEMEYEFGDYTAGRFAWKLQVVSKFKEPVPLTGHQGLFWWECPDNLLPAEV